MGAISWQTRSKEGPALSHCAKTMLLFSHVSSCGGVQGTTVITNLSSVLKDETIWEKPNEFYPEHFLDAKGQFVKPEAFLPFSAGKSEGRILQQVRDTAGGWSAPPHPVTIPASIIALFDRHILTTTSLLQVAVPVRENSWPGWSSFSSLPLSCRNSLSCSLRASPSHGWTVTLHSLDLHTHTSCKLSQDRCTPLSFHSQTTTPPNPVRNIAGLSRIVPGSISSLYICVK